MRILLSDLLKARKELIESKALDHDPFYAARGRGRPRRTSTDTRRNSWQESGQC